MRATHPYIGGASLRPALSLIASPLGLEIIAHAMNGPIPVSSVVTTTGHPAAVVAGACREMIGAGVLTVTDHGEIVADPMRVWKFLPYSTENATPLGLCGAR